MNAGTSTQNTAAPASTQQPSITSYIVTGAEYSGDVGQGKGGRGGVKGHMPSGKRLLWYVDAGKEEGGGILCPTSYSVTMLLCWLTSEAGMSKDIVNLWRCERGQCFSIGSRSSGNVYVLPPVFHKAVVQKNEEWRLSIAV